MVSLSARKKTLQSKVLSDVDKLSLYSYVACCSTGFLLFQVLVVLFFWFGIFVVLVDFFLREAVKFLYVQLIVPKTFYRRYIISKASLRGNDSIYQLHSFFLQLGKYRAESMPKHLPQRVAKLTLLS